MNALLAAQQHLMQALHADLLYQLVLLTVTLDPLWQLDIDDPADCDGETQFALLVARRAFPDVYVEAVLQQQSGVPETDLNRLICRGFSERGIPLEDIAWLGYGIPLVAGGLDLSDPELYTNTDFAAVLSWFGVVAEAEPYHVEVSAETYRVGRILADSLRQQPQLEWQNVGWLMAWLFSHTGNTLADVDEEQLYEHEPLTWEPADIELAVAMIAECQTIIEDAHTGLHWLLAHPAAGETLKANIRYVQQVVARNPNPRQVPRVKLTWANLAVEAPESDGLFTP
jgi:hypothetical protein